MGPISSNEFKCVKVASKSIYGPNVTSPLPLPSKGTCSTSPLRLEPHPHRGPCLHCGPVWTPIYLRRLLRSQILFGVWDHSKVFDCEKCISPHSVVRSFIKRHFVRNRFWTIKSLPTYKRQFQEPRYYTIFIYIFLTLHSRMIEGVDLNLIH